ncbi:helix-turn-helix domain-containing protein [Flavivirga rizhaonensis]|uniref:XRE family transcriptional regulator n=1 Tax=Flavivirga rizhaonensis TaxID=2559571 RepID=A0A4S1DR88_9FLAO|nr:helix-turn-helix transcriptional regulator [Flavivirga rizhaonensis]TGV00387.1 XRE family transcriptional regulator [Flavivirga rizhaonensis]
MSGFGKKLRECREAKNFSQAELAKHINSYHTIIGKYEKGEVKSSIDIIKKLAEVLETTGGYWLGETDDRELLVLNRLNDIAKDKECILYALDAMINNLKIKAI